MAEKSVLMTIGDSVRRTVDRAMEIIDAGSSAGTRPTPARRRRSRTSRSARSRKAGRKTARGAKARKPGRAGARRRKARGTRTAK